MASIRTSSTKLARSVFLHKRHPLLGYTATRNASTKSGAAKKSAARHPEVQRLLYQAEERYKPAGGGMEPIPRITLDHVTIKYANTGGPSASHVQKVSSRVDMRFNLKNADWLNERVKERIMQMEKNRITKDGEIVITSAKTRAQKSNNDDALAKLQVFTYQKKKFQAIIDAASYVPLPLSQETAEKISKLSTLVQQKQVGNKKALRRS